MSLDTTNTMEPLDSPKNSVKETHYETSSETENTQKDQKISGLSRVRQKFRLFSIVVFCGAQILDLLNVTGLILDTYQIALKYDISLETAVWAISAYSLTFGTFMLIGGRIADYIGHRKVFMMGMGIMTVCSAFAGGIPNKYVLFIFRAFQGIGAAMVIPTSFGLIAHTFHGEARVNAYAVVGSSASFGGVVGVIVGGAFAESNFGYRGLLLLSCGLSACFAILVFFVVEETPRYSNRNFTHLDWVGALLVICAGIPILFAFISAPGHWSKAKFIAPLVVGLVILCSVFVYHAVMYKRVKEPVKGSTTDSDNGFEPLLPKRLWSNTNYIQAFLYMGFVYSGFNGFMLTIAQEIQILRGSSPLMTGVQMLPIAISFIIGCVIGVTLAKLFNVRTLLVAGAAISMIGYGLTTKADQHNIFWRYLFVGELLVALGGGLSVPNALNAISMGAPMKDQGIASGGVQMFSQVLTAIVFSVVSSEIGIGDKKSQYQSAYYTVLAFSAVSILVGLTAKPVVYAQGLEEANNREKDDLAATSEKESNETKQTALESVNQSLDERHSESETV